MNRMIAGSLAGLAATHLMDGVGTILYTHWMDNQARDRERTIEPKFPLTVLGERIASAFNAQPVEQNGEHIGSIMHWGIGLFCGALYGLLEPAFGEQQSPFGKPIATALAMLSVDEFGFSAAGLCPPPLAFPYQTHVRALIAHLIYGVSLTLLYEGIQAYTT